MPRKGGKSASPLKRKEKEATYDFETSSHVEEDHDNVSHASHEDIRPMDDGGASDKGFVWHWTIEEKAYGALMWWLKQKNERDIPASYYR